MDRPSRRFFLHQTREPNIDMAESAFSSLRRLHSIHCGTSRQILRPVIIILYGFNIAALFSSLYIILWYSTSRHRLVDENLNPEVVRLEKRRILIGAPFMAIAIALALVNVYLGHAVLTVLGIYLMLPAPGVDDYWSRSG